MEELTDLTTGQILWVSMIFAIGAFLIVFALGWRSGRYCSNQYPLTKILDESKEPLSHEDINRAVYNVDLNASKEEQAIKFREDLKQNS